MRRRSCDLTPPHAVDQRGFVTVDAALRTTHPHIYAYGDVIGQEMFKHTFSYEGELAYRNAHFAKGAIIGAPAGFAKLLVENGSDCILGFHMIGPQAADLIHEVVVAMNAGKGTAELVRDSIHVHPTLTELIQQVFDATGP